jgi:hypothetical protein
MRRKVKNYMLYRSMNVIGWTQSTVAKSGFEDHEHGDK